MRTYKRKTERGKVSQEIFRTVAKEVLEMGPDEPDPTIGYKRNRQILPDALETDLADYLVECSKRVRQAWQVANGVGRLLISTISIHLPIVLGCIPSVPVLSAFSLLRSSVEDGDSIHCVKPTHTDRYLHNESNHHPRQKKGVVKTLVERARKVCSPEQLEVGRRTRRDWFLCLPFIRTVIPPSTGNLPAPPSTTQRSICDTEGSETQVEDHAQLEDESITVQQNSPPTSLSIIGDPPQHQIETPPTSSSLKRTSQITHISINRIKRLTNGHTSHVQCTWSNTYCRFL
ncbi:hypothetical protein QE152_g33997 [Popillia japonica]|uniref:Helix-turn-helix domain-containing protein n=1 Tax=Popillia japonica TaxID=7064 RepID=A0AAW1IV15_POPJA